MLLLLVVELFFSLNVRLCKTKTLIQKQVVICYIYILMYYIHYTSAILCETSVQRQSFKFKNIVNCPTGNILIFSNNTFVSYTYILFVLHTIIKLYIFEYLLGYILVRELNVFNLQRCRVIVRIFKIQSF